MFYAGFKFEIHETDIVGFETADERDAWVNFKDPLCVALGVDSKDCPFERMAIDNETAEREIEHRICEIDTYNPTARWYVIP